MRRETLSLTTTALVCALLSGCMVGPKYTRPAAPLAPEFKEATPESFKEMSGWKVAQPSDQTLRGKWWELFNDSQLNALEEQVDPANQTLKAAEANFRAARANIRFNRADQAPTLSVNPSVGADMETARLSLHAELAIDYFSLRSADGQKKLLDETVKAYQDALQLTQDRYDGGAAPLSDVAQARTQLQSAQVQDTDLGIQRAEFEHAIAVLVGKPPAQLSISSTPVTVQ